MSIQNTTVSVLNASFEPLSPTHLSKALVMVHEGRAEVIEIDESRTIRALGITFDFPKVIRLLSYIRVPFTYAEEFWSRDGVLRRDNHTCAYCLKTSADKKVKLTVDHIHPKSRFNGNADTWMNTITACQPCNGKKSDSLLSECGMVLKFEPSIPMRIYLRSNGSPRTNGRRGSK